MRHLTDKLTLSTSKYQKDSFTDDVNYHGTQHILNYEGQSKITESWLISFYWVGSIG